MEQEEKKYNGWLVSNNIFKRSLAIYWHVLLWYIIVMFTIWLLWIIFYILLEI